MADGDGSGRRAANGWIWDKPGVGLCVSLSAYDRVAVERIKALRNRRWNPDQKCWVCHPLTAYSWTVPENWPDAVALLALARDADLRIEPGTHAGLLQIAARIDEAERKRADALVWLRFEQEPARSVAELLALVPGVHRGQANCGYCDSSRYDVVLDGDRCCLFHHRRSHPAVPDLRLSEIRLLERHVGGRGRSSVVDWRSLPQEHVPDAVGPAVWSGGWYVNRNGTLVPRIHATRAEADQAAAAVRGGPACGAGGWSNLTCQALVGHRGRHIHHDVFEDSRAEGGPVRWSGADG